MFIFGSECGSHVLGKISHVTMLNLLHGVSAYRSFSGIYLVILSNSRVSRDVGGGTESGVWSIDGKPGILTIAAI